MGRPINKRYIGNTSQSGQQIQATAYFGGDSQARTAYINKQVGANTYDMTSEDGQYHGRVQLVPGGVDLTPGHANITVTPFGASGSGAVAADANLGVHSATVVVGGSGSTNTYYVPGDVLYPSSGTSSQRANLYVTTVSLGSAITVNQGAKYTVGDSFTWADPVTNVPAVVTVAAANATGAITSLGYVTGEGRLTSTSLTNTTPYTSSVTANVDAAGATFSVRWNVADLSVVNNGDYSTVPANHVALSGSAHGTGATTDINWQIASVQVTNGGSNYQAVAVSIDGNAEAVGVVNAAGSVSGITVTARGNGYTNTKPSVTISPISSVKHAAEIKNLTVNTFDNNSYEWVDSTQTPANGQAKLQTA